MARFVSAVLLVSRAVAGQWQQMPNGMYYHEDCIHQFDQEFHVQRSVDGSSLVTFRDDELETMELSPCEHKPRNSLEFQSSLNASVSYYSGWSTYAKTARSEGFGYMSSKWTVPAKPTARGPARQSSIYLFNGLEDGGGVKGASSLILQPVLQFGKSGCIINPLNWGKWWLTSYLVDGTGRAFCGARLGPLKEGEEVVGEMTLTNQTDNTWRVDSTRLSTGDVSTHSTTLNDVVIDSAYATAEGMIIYSCGAYPESGSCTFEENQLSDRDGNTVRNPQWEKVVLHTECNQDVVLPSSDTDPIKLVWDSSVSSESVAV